MKLKLFFVKSSVEQCTDKEKPSCCGMHFTTLDLRPLFHSGGMRNKFITLVKWAIAASSVETLCTPVIRFGISYPSKR